MSETETADTLAPNNLEEAQARAAAAFFSKARRAWVDAMPPDPDLWVLEIGCGGGATGALALREGKCGAWIGVELDARAAADALFALTDVIGIDPAGQDLPYGRSAFGLVFVGQGLAAFERPWRTLAAAQPLLRPGGRLILSVAARAGLPRKERKAGFTVGSVRRILTRAGFEALMVKAVGGKAGFLGLGAKPAQRIEAVARRR
jgi:SAM-dependent methyltransferase